MALTVPLSEIVEKSSNRLLGKHASWGRVLLGYIATVLNGFAFKSSEFSNSGGVPLIRIRDVGKDQSETTYLGEYDHRYVVEPGDLLVGMDGDFNCARWRGPRGLLNQRVCKITLKSDIYLPKFLDYTLPGYLKAINDVTSSVTVNCTVLLMSNYSHVGFPAAWALRKMSGDGPTQAKARGGDRPGDVPLHGPQPRVGGTLRVGEAF